MSRTNAEEKRTADERPPSGQTRGRLREVSKRASALVDEVSRAVQGKRDRLQEVTCALLAGGHVLLKDVPGVAKTLTARSMAQVLGVAFKRIQFTPDLLPADVTGSYVYRPESGEFSFRPGPLFANLILADEINRAPPKTQAALLEAMEERQVTVEGTTHRLPQPFVVIATQNPIEQGGTYPLPEAQLDRFMIQASLGYPSRSVEVDIVRDRRDRRRDGVQLRTLSSPDHLSAMQRSLEHVRTDDSIIEYIVDVTRATREDDRLSLGASPRACLDVLKLARAHAIQRARSYVVPEDVRAVAPTAVAHRVQFRGARAGENGPREVLEEVIAEVPLPSTSG